MIRTRLTLVVCILFAVLGCSTPTPVAADDPPSFYEPPEPLPEGNDGEVVKSEPAQLDLPAPFGSTKATRILYLSRDVHNERIVVSGLYIPAKIPWLRSGKAPLVVYAPSSHGLSDDCAPSKTLTGTAPQDYPELEIAPVAALLAAGASVVVTDYAGLGTPGPHTFMVRAAQAHAVLDAARAAHNIGRSGTPVGLFGYSQGGEATAAAAELAETYAPDLDVRGVFTGATPADMRAIIAESEGTKNVVIGLAALSGIVAAYPELAETVDAQLNADGRRLLRAHADDCYPENSATSSSVWTNDGSTINEMIAGTAALNAAFDEQVIGRVAPAMPVLVAISNDDDQVPLEQSMAMARSWCDLGATVEFRTAAIPKLLTGSGFGHYAGAVVYEPVAVKWLADRIVESDFTGNCGAY